jgi:hypothetical protein
VRWHVIKNPGFAVAAITISLLLLWLVIFFGSAS